MCRTVILSAQLAALLLCLAACGGNAGPAEAFDLRAGAELRLGRGGLSQAHHFASFSIQLGAFGYCLNPDVILPSLAQQVPRC
jgi:hypothetical protein